MYDEYHKSEEDIQKVTRYLQIYDPKNANREYTIQFINSMQGFGSEITAPMEPLVRPSRSHNGETSGGAS